MAWCFNADELNLSLIKEGYSLLSVTVSKQYHTVHRMVSAMFQFAGTQ